MNEVLHLGDISGKTVYQSAGTGSVHTAEGIAHNRAVAGLAQFIADPVGRHIHKHSVQGAAKTSEQCNQDHPDPVIDNKSQIAVAAAGAQYPVIHNYSHNAGLQQIHKNFTNHQQRADDSIMKVFSDKLPHSRVSPFQIKIMIIFYSKFKYGKYLHAKIE